MEKIRDGQREMAEIVRKLGHPRPGEDYSELIDTWVELHDQPRRAALAPVRSADDIAKDLRLEGMMLDDRFSIQDIVFCSAGGQIGMLPPERYAGSSIKGMKKWVSAIGDLSLSDKNLLMTALARIVNNKTRIVKGPAHFSIKNLDDLRRVPEKELLRFRGMRSDMAQLLVGTFQYPFFA